MGNVTSTLTMKLLNQISPGAKKAGQTLKEFDDLVRGMEMKGVTSSPEKFRQYMDGMAKAINSFGDTVTPSAPLVFPDASTDDPGEIIDFFGRED